MKDLFELLNKKGLKDDYQIEHSIMRHWSTTQIMDLKKNLYYVIRENNPPPVSGDISHFSFSPDSEISSQHNHCPLWDCRLSRVDELARFAAFYADSVYIQNYFSDYSHEPSNKYEEYRLRYHFAGDIKILLKLRKLILNDIIRFIPPLVPESDHICPTCFHTFVPDYKTIDKYLRNSSRELSEQYLTNTTIIVSLDKRYPDYRLYHFDVTGPQELYEHGRMVWIIPESSLPKPFQTKLKAIPDAKLKRGYRLSTQEVKESKTNERTLRLIFNDIWTQRCLAGLSGSNLKYLTHRDIDIKFLNHITRSPDLQVYNDTIKNSLIYELPVILGIPLESLLDLRAIDYDSFIAFRHSITYVVNEYVSNKKVLSPSAALEIYDDVVKPQLSTLNIKVKSFRDSHLRKAKRDIFVSTGLLTFGIFSTFLLPQIAAYPLALSAAEAIRGVKSIYDAFQLPEEIQNNNLYFLWKLQQK